MPPVIPPKSKPTILSTSATFLPLTKPSKFVAVIVPPFVTLWLLRFRVAVSFGEVSLSNLESIVTSVPEPVVAVPPVPKNQATPEALIGPTEPASVVNNILTIPDEVIVT